MLLPNIRNKASMSILISLIQGNIRNFNQCNKKRKYKAYGLKRKITPLCKQHNYVENPK